MNFFKNVIPILLLLVALVMGMFELWPEAIFVLLFVVCLKLYQLLDTKE